VPELALRTGRAAATAIHAEPAGADRDAVADDGAATGEREEGGEDDVAKFYKLTPARGRT
jgi:hypothetical protein